MDAGYRLASGHVSIMSRTDDVFNVAGHRCVKSSKCRDVSYLLHCHHACLKYRLSAGALEEACIIHQDVLEAAVIGLPDKIKGLVPLAFVVTTKREHNTVRTQY